jgi:hypothetical protein
MIIKWGLCGGSKKTRGDGDIIYENSIVKLTKNHLKRGGKRIRKWNRGDEFDQNTLHACMGTSQ